MRLGHYSLVARDDSLALRQDVRELSERTTCLEPVDLLSQLLEVTHQRRAAPHTASSVSSLLFPTLLTRHRPLAVQVLLLECPFYFQPDLLLFLAQVRQLRLYARPDLGINRRLSFR